jgi:preprotein translocase subunit SecF
MADEQVSQEPTEAQPAKQEAPPEQPVKKQKGPGFSLKNWVIHIYDTQYKKLMIIPALFIIAAIAVLLMSFARTGSFFAKDISLSGGVSAIAVTDFSDINGLQADLLNQFPTSDAQVRELSQLGKTTGIVVEASFQSEQDINSLLAFVSQKIGVPQNELTVQKMGASLGTSFFQQLLKGIIIAFCFMAVTVFIYFRIISGKWLWLPGLFVVWTAIVDILCTLAVVSFSGTRVSAAGLAAFLMLIGYSVDTDILLTVRALKGTDPTLGERIRSAVKTGVLMSMTAFGAVIAGYFFAEAETIKQIMFIISIGMIFDIIHTWLTNAGLLRWYLEGRGIV